MAFTDSQRGQLIGYVAKLRQYGSEWLFDPIRSQLGDITPAEIFEIANGIDNLSAYLNAVAPESINLGVEMSKYAKLAIEHEKRTIAARQASLRSNTHDLETLRQIDDLMLPITEFMNAKWYGNAEPFRLPPLTKFLTLSAAYEALQSKLVIPENRFDEKFGILGAQSTFLPNLRHARLEALLRNTETTVAFADIDGFKSFNTKFGETLVDRRILPVVMQTVESHIFSHGKAFRFGGDEYVMLMPNMNKIFAEEFMFLLQHQLLKLEIQDVDEAIRLSVGICTFPADSYLTDIEVFDLSNKAKNFAKEHGKDRISGYSSELFREEDLYHLSRNDPRLSPRLSSEATSQATDSRSS